MIWAANNMDAFMQYHGSNRGIFTVDWTAITTSPPTSDTSTGVVHFVYLPYAWMAITLFISTLSIILMF